MKTKVSNRGNQVKKVVGCTIREDKGNFEFVFFVDKKFVAAYYVPNVLKSHIKFGKRLSYRGLETKYEFALETLADVMYLIDKEFDGNYREVTIRTNSEVVRNFYSAINVKVDYNKRYRFPKV